MSDNTQETDETPETHESYGLVRFSRVQGSSGRLFGSSIEHHHFIEMSVSHARRNRSFQRDWYSSSDEIIRVAMSASQFAELITTLNVGEGVPVTIQRLQGKGMKPCPELSFGEKAHEDMRKEFKRLANDLAALAKTASETLTGPGALKSSDKAKVKAEIDRLIQEVGSNIPFVHQCFQEAVEKTVAEAKAEVDATVLHAQVTLGKEACLRLGLDGEGTKDSLALPAAGVDKMTDKA